MSGTPVYEPAPPSPLQAPLQTTPPGRYIVLYDGHCRLCTKGARKLVALARPGTVDGVSFQEPGALDRFPGLSYEACMQAMYLVAPDGRLFRGFEAAVRAVATRPLLGFFAYAYYLPGIRQLCDWLYAWIAANRYRFLGKAAEECAEGTCSVHFPSALRTTRKHD